MRPAMAVACCGAVGGDKSKAVPLAVAIEYIHNFTLIHDDLMDGDEVRRGMPTIHMGYGMPTAILAGDALFAKAYQIMCELDIPAERMREVLRYVSKAVWDLARGQQMDVNNEGKIVTEEYYTETIKLKTSVLFAAAAAGGAIIGGADDETVKAINEYEYQYDFIEKLSALPLSEDGKYRGTVSEGDFLYYILDMRTGKITDREKHRVRDIVRHDFNPAVRIDVSMDELLHRAVNQNFVPVVDDLGTFIGIVTRQDIIIAFIDKIEKG